MSDTCELTGREAFVAAGTNGIGFPTGSLGVRLDCQL
jgi:hypothetical protein